MTPELIADVYLYPTDRGGKKLSIGDRYRCPCFVAEDTNSGGWDCVIVRGAPLAPGERGQLGFVFLSGDRAVKALSEAGKFFLWESPFVGEATVVRPSGKP
jgi:hypothetical protein